MANVTINVDDDKEVTIPKICKVSTKYRRKQRTLQSPTFAETNNQINKTMAKEIIIETYKQRCECLGAEGMALDSILNLNNIFLPTPLVMSIRDSLKAYKVSKGEIQEAEFVAGLGIRNIPTVLLYEGEELVKRGGIANWAEIEELCR